MKHKPNLPIEYILVFIAPLVAYIILFILMKLGII